MAPMMPALFSSQPLWARLCWALLALILSYGVFAWPSLAARWGVSTGGVALLLAWFGAVALAWMAGKRARLVPVILIVAVAARLAAAALSAGRVSPGDPHSYLLLAEHLRAGTGLWIDEPYMGLRVVALYPPAYPLLLAGWSALFGVGALSLVVLGTLTDLASAGVIASIGARLGAPLAGRRAGLLALLWPVALFDAPLAQKESLGVLLVLLLARLWLAERPAALALGAVAALLALTQPGWAPIAAMFGLAFGLRLGWVRLARTGVLAGLAAALVMLPWWLRNAVLLGAFVPLTSAGGVSLWIGNHAGASGVWEPQPRAWHGLGELAYAARAAAEAKAWMLANPIACLHLNLAKFLRATGAGDFALVRLAAMQPPLAPAIAALCFPLLQGAQLALWGGSVFAARWREDPALRAMLLLVAVGFAQILLVGVWFEFGERHRAFLTPLLLLLVARAGERVRLTLPASARSPSSATAVSSA